MRRFTRLTNGHSKKLESHPHMLVLYFTDYDFVRIHKTLERHAVRWRRASTAVSGT